MATVSIATSQYTTATITYTVSETDTTTTVTVTKVYWKNTRSGGWTEKYWWTLDLLYSDGFPVDTTLADGTLQKGATTATKTGTWKWTHQKTHSSVNARFELNAYDASADYDVYKHSAYFSLGVKTSYIVKYAANGGTSTPSSQTKWYGETLGLRGAISRNQVMSSCTTTFNGNGGSTPSAVAKNRYTTYAFNGWKASNGTVYGAGANYTANAATTMTAQWNPTTQAYPSFTLPTPTRQNYAFAGWFTAASGGTQKSSPFTPTGNSTLYAHWTQVYASPQLNITSVYRCDSDGNSDDEGKYAGVKCSYQIYNTSDSGNAVNTTNLPSCTVSCSDDSSYTPNTQTASSGSGEVKNTYSSPSPSGNWKTGECFFVVNANMDTDKTYQVEVTLRDTKGGGSYSQNHVTKTAQIASAFYTIDVLAGGHGICFGGVAKGEGLEVDFNDIQLCNSNPSTDTFYTANNLSSNPTRSSSFGIGSGGANAGIWDHGLSKWLIYSNGTDAVNIYDNGSGTYVNMLKQAATGTNAFSANSSTATLVDASLLKFGRVVLVRIRYKLKSALSVPASGNITNVTVGTIAAGYCPAQWTGGYSVGDDAGAAWHSIAADGVVTLGACEGTGSARSISTDTVFVCTATYLTG